MSIKPKTPRRKTATRIIPPKQPKLPEKHSAMQVILLVDRSGSMARIWNETVRELMAFVEQQRKEDAASPVQTTLRLVFFDRAANEVCVDVRDVSLERPFTWPVAVVPRGDTPLYDAVGHVASLYGDADFNSSLLVIVTDGQENASASWTRADVARKLDELVATGRWTVQYIGQHRDAWQEASSFVPASQMIHTLSYQPDAAGTRNVYGSIGMSVNTLRTRTSEGEER